MKTVLMLADQVSNSVKYFFALLESFSKANSTLACLVLV